MDDRSEAEEIPIPPRRREPLPAEAPKEAVDDPEAPERLDAITNHASYRLAERDLDFLARMDTTAVRLLLEYLKPQLALRDREIRSTVVVFGGTRILEPAAAARRLHEARTALAHAPGDEALEQRVRICERVVAKSHFYDVAREFGRIVSRASLEMGGRDYVVVTGGGPGVMEATNRGAFDVGAESIGLNITLPHEQYPNPYITPGLCFQFRYFALRKMHFLRLAVALVAFPGGYGTLDEIFEVLCLIQTRKIDPIPVVLVGKRFWKGAFDVEFLMNEGVIDPEDAELFAYAESAAQVRDQVLGWYRRRSIALPQPSAD